MTLPAPTAQNAVQSAAEAERVEAMILLTERLTASIALDAAAFEQRRPHEAASRLEETSKLANMYRHESMRIRQNPEIVAKASLSLRTRLTRATEAFDAVLARQGRALEAAKTVTDGLVRAIAEEISSQRGQGAGYGAKGAVKPPVSTSTAITLNRRA